MKARWILVSLPLLAAACAESHAEQVRDARLERVDEQADAKKEQAEQRADARDKALDQQYQAREDSVEAKGGPGSDQSEELLKLSKERSDYQSQKREQLDKLAVRIQAAQKKISVLGDRAPTKLHSELQAAQTEHQNLQNELSQLSSVRSNGWETEKKRLDDRISGLDSRVGRLSSDIDDAAG